MGTSFFRAATYAGVAVLFSLSIALSSVPASAQTTPSPDIRDDQFAVAYQINAAHTGAITFDNSFKPPLKVLWVDTAEGPMSYPLIARGKVFVFVVHGSGGGRVYALDEKTGGVLWQTDLAGTSTVNSSLPPTSIANIAYDRGHVFVLNSWGVLISLNADTGAQEWTLQLSQLGSMAPPTAANGTVFATGANVGGTLYAVDEASGSQLWTQPVNYGNLSAPTLSGEGVFVTYPCEVYDFNPATGTPIWHIKGPCLDGGGGATSSYYRGHLYDTTFKLSYTDPGGDVFDTNTSQFTGTFGAPIFQGAYFEAIAGPAFKGNVRYFVQNGQLFAEENDNGTSLWSFAPTNDTIAFAPLVINDTVFVITSFGTLYALDRITGEQVWSANGGFPATSPATMMPGGMAAGEGILVVPDGWQLYALVPASEN